MTSCKYLVALSLVNGEENTVITPARRRKFTPTRIGTRRISDYINLDSVVDHSLKHLLNPSRILQADGFLIIFFCEYLFCNFLQIIGKSL